MPHISVHYTSLTADHWCKVAMGDVVRMRDLLIFVDTPACLAQEE